MRRSYKPELMDDFQIQDGRINEALNELKIINKYLGGISTTTSALKYFIRDKTKRIKIADIGSGSSDTLIASNKHFPNIHIVSIDKNQSVLKYSINSAIKLNSDAFTLPFKDESFEIVHASLFLHHFAEDQICDLISEFFRICKKGIIINDLRRSYLALLGIKLLTLSLSKSILVKNDAPLSVKRGFVKSDLINLIKNCNISNFIIKRKWAFRWMIILKK